MHPRLSLLEIGSISEAEFTVKIASKALTKIELFDNAFIVGDGDGHIYLIDDQFDVLIKSRIHKGAVTSIDWIMPSDASDTVFLTGATDYNVRLRNH